VTHSPGSSSWLRASPGCRPSALADRIPPPLPLADTKLGVAGRPKVGEDILAPPAGPEYMDPGRARREGERPPGGSGDEERGGGPEPLYLFCVSVREKMAWDRDDWAFISVSLVRLMDVPLRRRLWDRYGKCIAAINTNSKGKERTS
jgi:hypothetical protein